MGRSSLYPGATRFAIADRSPANASGGRGLPPFSPGSDRGDRRNACILLNGRGIGDESFR